MRLRLRIILFFVAASMGSLIVVSAVGYRFIADNTRNNIRQYLAAQVDGELSVINEWLTSNANAVAELAWRLQQNEQLQTVTSKELGFRPDNKDLSDIYIGFEDGRFVSAIGWKPPKGYDPRVRPWYKQAKQTGKLNFSEPYMDMTTGKVAISIGLPIKDQNGRLVGILAEDILIDTLIERIKKINLDGIGFGVLLDQSGYALYHPDKQYDKTNLLDNPETTEIIQTVLKQSNGTMEYQLKGTSRLMLYKMVPHLNLELCMVIYKDKAYHQADQLKNSYILFILIAAALHLIAAIRFSTNVYAERLEQLVKERTEAYNRVNAELIGKNHELQDTLQILEATQRQLVETEKLASLGAMVAGVSHELNTPLGICITSTSYLQKIISGTEHKLQDKSLGKNELSNNITEAEQVLALLEHNLGRTTNIVRQFKMLDAGHGEEYRTEFSLHEVVDGAFKRVILETDKATISFHNDCVPDLMLFSFREALIQVIAALVRNSVRHAFHNNDHGIVGVSAEKSTDRIRIRVKDNGDGMDQEIVSHIFDAFFTTDRIHGSIGIGLTTAHNLVTQKLGGSIHCENSSGEGTCFIIELPI